MLDDVIIRNQQFFINLYLRKKIRLVIICYFFFVECNLFNEIINKTAKNDLKLKRIKRVVKLL